MPLGCADVTTLTPRAEKPYDGEVSVQIGLTEGWLWRRKLMKGRLQKLKDVAKKLGREQENQAGTRAVRELLLHLLLKLLFMVVTHLFLLLSSSFPPPFLLPPPPPRPSLPPPPPRRRPSSSWGSIQKWSRSFFQTNKLRQTNLD